MHFYHLKRKLIFSSFKLCFLSSFHQSSFSKLVLFFIFCLSNTPFIFKFFFKTIFIFFTTRFLLLYIYFLRISFSLYIFTNKRFTFFSHTINIILLSHFFILFETKKELQETQEDQTQSFHCSLFL